MTGQDWINKQKKALSAFENDKTSPLRIAAFDTHAKMCERIFEDGKKADGSDIGKYNTTDPLYINPNTTAGARKTSNSVKGISGLKLAGKNGQTKFKNGKTHKTAYVSSYSDLRSKSGKRVDKVNLIFSGELRSDFSNGKIPTPEKINNFRYVAGVKKEVDEKKIEGLTEKYGDIFKLTKGERKNFVDTADFEFKRLLDVA